MASGIDFSVDLKVRRVGDETWQDEIYYPVDGEMVEFQCIVDRSEFIGKIVDKYREWRYGSSDCDVTLRIELPYNMEYISGSTMVSNEMFPYGVQYTTDDIVSSGIPLNNFQTVDDYWVTISCWVFFEPSQLEEDIWNSTATATATVTVNGVSESDSVIPVIKN